MEPSCIRQDLIPGTTRLFSNYLYNFREVENFYPAGAPEADQVIATARRMSFPEDRRAAIVNALSQQNEDRTALDKLARAGTVAIVSGQQVGLFSGPAYTIFKALTAVKLAEHLESQGVPAVPIFWLATEDHDLAEVDHTWVLNDKGEPVRISSSGLVASGGPVGVTRLTDLPLAALRSALGWLPFADEVMEKVAAAYQEGATLGSAFAAFLKDLLSGFGLLFLDPLQPAIRTLAAPFLLQAAQRAPELVNGLLKRATELESAGYHAQVLVEKDASLLFLLSGNKRLPLRMRDGKLFSRDTELNLEEAAARLSPNALLRPVLQDFLLPTAAYVAGPAEIAYFAQSSVLYQALLGRMPVIFPRNSFTLLDARADKLIAANHLRLTDLLDYKERVKEKIAVRLVPKDLASEFDKLEKNTAAALLKLQTDLLDFDPTLKASAEKSSAKILYQIEKLRRKTARETLRRDQQGTADTDHLTNLVYPHKHLQERLYSIVPFLAKYGTELPRTLYDQTQLSCPDHMVRTF